jgi:hypothetical protein
MDETYLILILCILIIFYYLFKKKNKLKIIKNKNNTIIKDKIINATKNIEIKNHQNFNIYDDKSSFRGIVFKSDSIHNTTKVKNEKGGSKFFDLIKLNNNNENNNKIDFNNYSSYRRMPTQIKRNR